MATIKLVLSDLHLADGHAILESFEELQQFALEGLLNAACSNSPLDQADTVELILNGDAFDFLAIKPYDINGTIDAPTALAKLETIISAHGPFFAALGQFIKTPGRYVTFITGNHDIELCFEEIRSRICKAIGVAYDAAMNDRVDTGEQRGIHFCPTHFYRPLPDVYIEHGNQYDFWNACTKGLWNEQGQPITRTPATIVLPAGTHYFQHSSHPISTMYPYFDHFEPSINTTRQIALLCLLNPEIVIETAQRTMQMLSQPRKALADLAPGDEHTPVKLFEQAMLDFAAFQLDMLARYPEWSEPEGTDPARAQADAFMEYMMLREVLHLPEIEAVAAICTPAVYSMSESVARGMHAVLKHDPLLRYAIAGHTHMARIDSVHEGTQTYLNTATWTARMALPSPGEITPAMVEWLRHPDWNAIPLRDVTQLTFALLNATENGPSSASLCVWEGGANGRYRVLA
jgi:UDP-2,3-diacylglucosamine pyrophosphatase LpxH